MKAKRAFILGAGFSKQAGMPLATELTPLILEKFKGYGQDEALSWFEWLKQRVDWLARVCPGKSSGINIEQVFDLAWFDTELWKMEQHRCALGRTAGDTPWQAAEDIEAWLTHMEDDLIDVIWEHEKKALQKLSGISRFSQNLRADDVVLTFNYDTLLEGSLAEQERPWHYGFGHENGTGVAILKMHGSINWLRVPRGERANFGYPLLFRKEDRNRDPNDYVPIGEEEYDTELIRVPDDKLGNRIENRILQHTDKRYSIGIAGLGSYKPLHHIPGTGQVWFNGIRALREAEEIYVIGFSLSPFDSMVRLYLGGLMVDRADKNNLPKTVTLIDTCAARLEPNFHSAFGPDTPIRTIERKAQDIDWEKLLGG